jgi:hypothetical protein
MTPTALLRTQRILPDVTRRLNPPAATAPGGSRSGRNRLNETASGRGGALWGFFLARLWAATAEPQYAAMGFLLRAALGCERGVDGAGHARRYRVLTKRATPAWEETAAAWPRSGHAAAARSSNAVM